MIDKLITKIQYIMKSSRKSRRGLSFERLLYNLSKVYKNGIQFRNYLYRAGILKSKKLPCFVISIGNISTGGTGKTPMTMYLSKYLTTLGYKVAIVTRGYKGKFEHKNGVVSNGKKILCGPEEAGDEPYMMAQALKLPVIAGKKRFKSGMTAIEKFSPDIIVLDDAFQHIALKRNLNLLLLDTKKPIGNGYLLPRGSLREPAASIQRSDAVIFTRSDQNPDTAFDSIDIELANIPMFKTVHAPLISKIATKKKNVQPTLNQTDMVNHLKGKRAFLFSGIANNPDFKSSCEKIGLIVCHQIEFPDHYWYKQHDINKLTKAFKQINADYMVTTQKDYIKIADNFPFDHPLVVLDVQIKFDHNNKTAFGKFIKEKTQKHFEKTKVPE